MKKNLIKITISLLIITIIAVYFTFNLFYTPTKESIYIAVVGPMSGGNEKNGKAMLSGVNMCLEEFNNEKSKRDYEIKVKVFDDENNVVKAKRIAEEIASDEKILMVLGHYYSSTSIAGGKIYKDKQIPAITASATSEEVLKENDWYFRTIPGNAMQGSFIAYYVKNVLKQQSAHIIYDNDVYGRDLATSFEKTAIELNMKVKKWGFKSKESYVKLEDIITEIRSEKNVDVIFLATHVPEGARIITSLKYPGASFTIVGSDAFSSEAFLKELIDISFQERATPGYHSDGIYTVSPFIIDIANEKAQIFRNNYLKKYKEEPSWIAASYYDSMLTAIQAISKTVNIKRRSFKNEKIKIKDYLNSLNHVERSIFGVTGNIFFNKNREITRPLGVGVYKNQRLISALTQYELLLDNIDVNQVLDEMLQGQIIKIGKTYMQKTRLVYTGFDITEAFDLNLGDQSYIIDFYLWFRYEKDFEQAWNIEFCNTVNPLFIDNRALIINKGIISQIHHKEQNNIVTRAFRIKTRFKGNFDLHAYPFDQHKLRIKFRHQNLKRNKLIFVSDVLGMHQLMKNDQEFHMQYNTLAGWEITGFYYYQDLITNDSSLGDPEYFEAKNNIIFSQFNAQINIKRELFSFLIKNLFLILVLVVISYISYFIPIDQFGIRISIGMSTLLTTAFSHIRISNNLQVGYVLAIEYAFFGVYAISALSIFISVIIYHLYKLIEHEKTQENYENIIKVLQKRSKKFTLCGLILHPLVVLLISFFLTYFYIYKLS